MTDRAQGTSSTELMDAHDNQLEACELQLRQYGGRVAFAGRVTTVACREDNAVMKSVLSEAGAGRVAVIDGGGSLRAALLGRVIATIAAENDWEGIVLNGAVRDVGTLAVLDLGVKALGTSPRKSSKLGTGVRDASVKFGGVTFEPGMILVSDDDGIVTLRDA